MRSQGVDHGVGGGGNLAGRQLAGGGTGQGAGQLGKDAACDFVVLVNAQDQLLIESEYATLEDVRRLAKEFIDNNGDGTCEGCRGLRDPNSSDNPRKAVISLQNDRGTSYKTFVAVRNELLGAYSELREDLSQRRFGRSYDDLSESDKEAVNEIYPQFISEAEPVKIGG